MMKTAAHLNERAVQEITRTFNGLTGAPLTVAEYMESQRPGAAEWPGDVCGCTDDRCIGFHHDESDACGCLDYALDELHEDLAVAVWLRDWQAEQPDPARIGRVFAGILEDPRAFYNLDGLQVEPEQIRVLDGFRADVGDAAALNFDTLHRAMMRLLAAQAAPPSFARKRATA